MRDYIVKSNKVPEPDYVTTWNKHLAPILAKEHARQGLEDDDEPLICVDYVVYGAFEWAYATFVAKHAGIAIDINDFKAVLLHYLTGKGM